jgi:uncharacterized Rmd1/YagE family protein
VEASTTIFEDLPGLEEGAGMRGRITVYCIAEALDRKALELRLRGRGGAALLHQYPDVLYGLYESTKVGSRAPRLVTCTCRAAGCQVCCWRAARAGVRDPAVACLLQPPLLTQPAAWWQDGEACRGECFYFDYGAVAFWNLSEAREREVIRGLLGPCLVDALPAGEVEVDEFQVGGWAHGF